MYEVTKKSRYTGKKTVELRCENESTARAFCSRFSMCANSVNAYIDAYGNVYRIEKGVNNE